MLLTPREPVRHNGLGQIRAEVAKCWSQSEYQKIPQILQRIHRLQPDNFEVLIESGSAHALNYDFAEAERCFEKAVDLSVNKVEALMKIAHHWLQVRHFAAAKNCFERILQQPSPPVLAYTRLVEIYERQRELHQADQLIDLAVARGGPHIGGA